MSQELNEDPEKNFSTKFRKALRAYDFERVFTMWKWLEDRLRKRNVTDRILAIRDFIHTHRRKVMLLWYRRINRLLLRKNYDEALCCYKALQIRFPETKEAIHLVMLLEGFHITQFEDFQVRLAKAFFHDKDLGNCKKFLLPLPSGGDGVEEDTEVCTVLLYVEVLMAERCEAEAVTLLEQRVERCEELERFKCVHEFRNRLEEIEKPEVIDVDWHDEEMTFTIENIVFGDEPGKAFTPQQYWTLRLSHGLCKKKCETSVHENEVMEELEKCSQVSKPYGTGFGERRHAVRKAHERYPGLGDIVWCLERRIYWQPK